jgi:hypothetical protein
VLFAFLRLFDTRAQISNVAFESRIIGRNAFKIVCAKLMQFTGKHYPTMVRFVRRLQFAALSTARSFVVYWLHTHTFH